jgi:hypothetical protein
LYLELVNFFEENEIHNSDEGENIYCRLLKAHYSDPIYAELIRYVNTHEKKEWEKDIRDVCEKMLGINGYVTADFMVKAIEDKKEMENVKIVQSKQCNNLLAEAFCKIKFIVFSPKMFFKIFKVFFLTVPCDSRPEKFCMQLDSRRSINKLGIRHRFGQINKFFLINKDHL